MVLLCRRTRGCDKGRSSCPLLFLDPQPCERLVPQLELDVGIGMPTGQLRWIPVCIKQFLAGMGFRGCHHHPLNNFSFFLLAQPAPQDPGVSARMELVRATETFVLELRRRLEDRGPGPSTLSGEGWGSEPVKPPAKILGLSCRPAQPRPCQRDPCVASSPLTHTCQLP